MSEDEKVVKKVKVQIGRNISSVTRQTATEETNATPVFTDDIPTLSLADLVDPYYLLRQRNKQNTGDIFPAARMGKSKSSNNIPSKPRLLQPAPDTM